MATDADSPAGLDPRPWRRRWQVPTFLSGLAALLAVWIARPLLRAPEGVAIERELAALRRSLESPRPDAAAAAASGEALIGREDLPEGVTGEAHFLLGTALLRRAAGPPEAAEYWQPARHHLEQAVHFGVADADRSKLLFRLAKAWSHTGGDPKAIVEYLTGPGAEGADADPGEPYALLADAYLRLPTPDVKAALEANAKQLAVSAAGDDVLAAARLLRGELLAGLDEGEEARQVLARVPAAFPALYHKARLIMAQTAQHDRLWADAAPLWEGLVKDPAALGDRTGTALYCLGVCYARLARDADAARVWDRALRYEPDVGRAAAFGLAELALRGDTPAAALEPFERAVQGIASPAGYANKFVDLAEARALFERAFGLYAKFGDHASTRRLTRAYLAVAPEGAAARVAATAAAAWADECRRRAVEPGGDADRLRAEAAAHDREAAADYEALARAGPDAATWLRLAAERYRLAGARAEEADALNRQLAIETEPEHLGEAWVRLSESMAARGDASAARKAAVRALEYPGPWAFRARLAVARLDAAEGRPDDAIAALRQNIDLMRATPDEPVYERSLLALADLLVRRDDRGAAALLQEALERYPNHEGAAATRLRLAECYRRLAAREDQGLRAGAYLTGEAQNHYREQRRRWLQMAAAHYQKLVDDGAARALGRDEAALRDAGFALAETRFELGDFAAAARLFEELADRCPHDPDALRALKQAARCHWVLREPAKATEAVRRLRAALADVPDAAFASRPEAGTRREWQDWLAWAERQQ